MTDHILVTGSAGRIGRAAVTALTAAGLPVVGFDLSPTPGLAPDRSVVGTPDDGDNFLSELVPNNIVGSYHVLEAVRKERVPRVILASTGQVVDNYVRTGRVPVTTTLLPEPRYLYACTKVFLKALGQVYAWQHGMR